MHEFSSIIIKCFSALFQRSLEFLCLRLYLSSFANILWKILGLRAFVAKLSMSQFTHFIRKVFAMKILLSGKFLLFLTLLHVPALILIYHRVTDVRIHRANLGQTAHISKKKIQPAAPVRIYQKIPLQSHSCNVINLKIQTERLFTFIKTCHFRNIPQI